MNVLEPLLLPIVNVGQGSFLYSPPVKSTTVASESSFSLSLRFLLRTSLLLTQPPFCHFLFFLLYLNIQVSAISFGSSFGPRLARGVCVPRLT